MATRRQLLVTCAVLTLKIKVAFQKYNLCTHSRQQEPEYLENIGARAGYTALQKVLELLLLDPVGHL